MDKFLASLPIFVEVAKNKSFTRAAENLGIFSSTVSRRIASFEREAGVPLLLRSTRSVELTDAGRLMLERGLFILEEAESVRDAVVGNLLSTSGPVRVSLHEDGYLEILRGVLCEFAKKWPGIRLEVSFNERPVDLLTEPYDVDFRVGPLEDSSLKARKIITVEPYLYAAPSLLKRYPTPACPGDLRKIPCICLNRVGKVWKLRRVGEEAVVPIQPAHSFGSTALVHEFTVAGQGVSMLRPYMALRDEKVGRLVRLLPEWTGPKHDLFLVMPPGQMPRRVRLFVDYLADFFARMPR